MRLQRKAKEVGRRAKHPMTRKGRRGGEVKESEEGWEDVFRECDFTRKVKEAGRRVKQIMKSEGRRERSYADKRKDQNEMLIRN